MAVLKIRKYGDPILRQRARPVAQFDEALQALARDMVETMQAASGIGLAANQVGFSHALCVVDMGLLEEGAPPRAFVNPVILTTEGDSITHEEGCLSIPDVSDEVERRASIRLRFQDLDGAVQEGQFAGMAARVLQHEIDHLNGVFFVDRLSPLRRRLLAKKLKEIATQAQRELADLKAAV